MLDTNTLIYFIKNKPPSEAARIDALKDDDALCMSFVTYAELLKGTEGSARKAEVLQGLGAIVRQVPVLYAVGRALCEHYAMQSTRLKAAGTPIGGNDLCIACHALAEGATLVTNDAREFGRVVGLAVDNWAR